MIVFAPKRFVSLLRADALNVSRDPVLMVGIVMVLVPPVLLALFGQAIDAAASDAFGFENLSAVLAACALVLCGGLIGWVVGFLLLEDRDDNVLLALEITPIGKTGFIAYRLTMAFAVTFLAALATALVALPQLGLTASIGAAVLCGLHACATALFLLAFASNKVEGLALTKLVNIALFGPALALLPSPIRYAAAIVPPFWVGEIAGLATSPLPLLPALLIGLALYAITTTLLTHRVAKRLG